jgi:hypothetical protein
MVTPTLPQKQITFTLELSDAPVRPGDAFYFEQEGGLPTIRMAQAHEDWDGLGKALNTKTGQPVYRRIEKVTGVLFSPKIFFHNLTS